MVTQIDVKENKHIFISSHKLKLLINENSKGRGGQRGRGGGRTSSSNVIFSPFSFCVFLSFLFVSCPLVLLSFLVVFVFLSSCVYSSLTAWSLSRDADQRDKSRSRQVRNELSARFHVCVRPSNEEKEKETLSNYVYSTCATQVGVAATPHSLCTLLNGPNLLLSFLRFSPSPQVHLH